MKPLSVQQVCVVHLPTRADNVTLPAFAAEHQQPLLSIRISCPPDQQKSHYSSMQRSIAGQTQCELRARPNSAGHVQYIQQHPVSYPQPGVI